MVVSILFQTYSRNLMDTSGQEHTAPGRLWQRSGSRYSISTNNILRFGSRRPMGNRRRRATRTRLEKKNYSNSMVIRVMVNSPVCLLTHSNRIRRTLTSAERIFLEFLDKCVSQKQQKGHSTGPHRRWTTETRSHSFYAYSHRYPASPKDA